MKKIFCAHFLKFIVPVFAMLLITCGAMAADQPKPTAPAAKPAAPAAKGNDAAAPGKDPLTLERWSERSYGVSLRVPLGSRLIEQTADDAILRIYGAENYVITLFIKKSGTKLTMNNVLQEAIAQIAVAQPSARLVENEKEIKLAGRPGGIVFFRLPATKRDPRPWVLGEAFMQLDPTTVVLLKLEVDDERFEKTRPVFEAVMQSLGVENVEDLDRERQVQIEAGKTWHQTINYKRLQMALIPDQWFRVIEEKNDIGYARVRQGIGKEMDMPGIQLDIQTRVQVDEKVYESLSQFFLSEDGSREIWSVKTTVSPVAGAGSSTPTNSARKPGNPKIKPLEVSTFIETGVRSGMKITVTSEAPTGKKEYQWEAPPVGYLSQVELFLLDVLLPKQQNQTMGFYAYYANTGKLAFRTERVVLNPQGGCRIATRPSPEQPEQVSFFDAAGKMIRRELPSGRSLIPSTLEQVQSINRLKNISQ